MKMQLARHDETPFNVFFTSPEKVSSIFFPHFRDSENIKEDSIGVPFSKIV
jgi:hypothetical protein